MRLRAIYPVTNHAWGSIKKDIALFFLSSQAGALGGKTLATKNGGGVGA
jgi:hypothetical protein